MTMVYGLSTCAIPKTPPSWATMTRLDGLMACI